MAKSIAQVFKDIWPKLAIFTVMLVITIFQKHPMTLKALGQSDEEIQQQFNSGEFKTTPFEKDYLAYIQIEKIAFTLVVFIIFYWFRRKNLQYEEEQAKLYLEKEKEKKIAENKRLLQEQKYEFTDDDIKFYREANEKMKQKEQKNKQKYNQE
ncbi:unnamed protein product (macronuclear) [Paramecium tetraurelia]|uniref:Uncharacterized protein n=1 Tax=Paramecium tetraurelia TaxID=5888 RepID=A0DBS0_PARTE|nr:uncharacterized protein GSPATT00015384001 [Paramecium tetraurelia]CAK80487.1 unnamed protein product [Paramecium tetraurelia]|eukprot:XP_001447884.1 hypothetical protein (macronuclear) [Paramecium tetraurelia strain d4-2]